MNTRSIQPGVLSARARRSGWTARRHPGVRLTAAALAVGLAVLVSGCGSDGMESQESSGGMTKSEVTEKEAAPATDPFARLEPADFADKMKNQDAMVVNVHIPYEGELAETDAFIPYDTIVGDSRLPQEKDREILLYCRSGRMSEEAGAALHDAGYTKVAHLEGGMNAWEASGRELIQNPAHASEGSGTH